MSKKTIAVRRLGAEKKQGNHNRRHVVVQYYEADIAYKNNEQVRQDLYDWFLYHKNVLQSPVANYCLKVSIDGNTEKQVITKLLLKVSER